MKVGDKVRITEALAATMLARYTDANWRAVVEAHRRGGVIVRDAGEWPSGTHGFEVELDDDRVVLCCGSDLELVP